MIFAQLPINQFSSIAWFNVAMGMAAIISQILGFRGEMKCNQYRNYTLSTKSRRIKKISHDGKNISSKLLPVTVSLIYQLIYYAYTL